MSATNAVEACPRASTGSTTWVSSRTICDILTIYHQKVRALAREGKIRVRTVPGSNPRYCLEDAVALRG